MRNNAVAWMEGPPSYTCDAATGKVYTSHLSSITAAAHDEGSTVVPLVTTGPARRLARVEHGAVRACRAPRARVTQDVIHG